jgi:hypothetical protein
MWGVRFITFGRQSKCLVRVGEGGAPPRPTSTNIKLRMPNANSDTSVILQT